MFEIKFRITEDLEELKSASLKKLNREMYNIYGLFSLTISRQDEIGFYEEGLPEEFVGDEAINSWLEYLLEVMYLLRKEKNCAVIMLIVELDCPALLFRRCDDDRSISISYIDVRILGDQMKIVGYDDKEGYDYDIEWTESGLSYSDVEQTVIEKAKEFIRALKEINPILVETNMARLILEKIEELESYSIVP